MGKDKKKAAGQADDRGRLKVNENYQTDVPHIYAAGDVIGFPSLASTSLEQGRLASCHAFGESCVSMPHLFPFGIYSIPEISMVGKTEEELTHDRTIGSGRAPVDPSDIRAVSEAMARADIGGRLRPE